VDSESLTARAAQAAYRGAEWTARLASGEVVKRVGGPARARVVVMFGCVLALGGADAATVGAVAPSLEHSLHIGNTKIGLLSSATLLVGAIFTIPVGLLVDRIKRVPMLSFSIALWSIASLASAFAHNYSSLLLTRLFLGAVTATAGPAIASLSGDFFPASERGRIWAYILGGEAAGTAVGFIVCGSVASLIGWRAAFVLLAIPGFFLARELYRTVPEPLRGGQSFLEPGVVDLREAVKASASQPPAPEDQDEPEPDSEEGALAREAATRLGARPDPRLVLDRDPRSLDLVSAVRYILSIPTNVLMIISSSLGYFYFAGLSTFALLFVRGHFHASQATADLALGMLVIGMIVGTLVSGAVSDKLLRGGFIEVRVWIPAVCYLAAACLFVPGILGAHLTPALWFDVAGAGLIAAANPPLDAARLDIMPAGLWGRAESTRTVLRSLAQALAPLVFGGLADLIAGIFPEQAPVGTHPGVISPGAARGLQVSFLVLLGTLAAAGLVMLRARSTYPRDVATAAASNQGHEEPVPVGS
jgi:MFS family permease